MRHRGGVGRVRVAATPPDARQSCCFALLGTARDLQSPQSGPRFRKSAQQRQRSVMRASQMAAAGQERSVVAITESRRPSGSAEPRCASGGTTPSASNGYEASAGHVRTKATILRIATAQRVGLMMQSQPDTRITSTEVAWTGPRCDATAVRPRMTAIATDLPEANTKRTVSGLGT